MFWKIGGEPASRSCAFPPQTLTPHCARSTFVFPKRPQPARPLFMHSSDLLPAAFAGAMLIVVVCVVLIGYAIQVFVCWNLMGCLQRLPAQYRKMEPALVWLLLIPCFHLLWNFFVYLRIPASYQAYFAATGKGDGSDFGRGIGLAYAICAVCCFIPLINYLAGPAALILLIVFLVKAAGYKKQIAVEAAPTAVPPSPVA